MTVLGAGLAACGSGSNGGGTASSSPAAAPCSPAGIRQHLCQPGVLTAGTGKPACPPWFAVAASGMTMLIATHEMGFAGHVAHRVCFLAGAVHRAGTARRTVRRPARRADPPVPAPHHRGRPAVTGP